MNHKGKGKTTQEDQAYENCENVVLVSRVLSSKAKYKSDYWQRQIQEDLSMTMKKVIEMRMMMVNTTTMTVLKKSITMMNMNWNELLHCSLLAFLWLSTLTFKYGSIADVQVCKT
ncbi:hypothetical protein RHMOL_Rhmol13G0172400 [Rhododendron molle]|uniref:Uncharacterized protein n=1 Tax=Rhododendron molle TaxID=49168 RepID=A0ACC0L7P8_RHOML|nr:hypothetical protein RHMOL_Rhmol13G0172400 [Rhododendron molle]